VGAGEITNGEDQRGRVGDLQVGAQAGEQPDVIAGGPLIVAGDRAQLSGDFAVRDELTQPVGFQKPACASGLRDWYDRPLRHDASMCVKIF
jgi:hypothetical protein